MVKDISNLLRKIENCTPVIAEAIEQLNDGDMLLLGGGEIDLYPQGAYRKYCYISNNDCGEKNIAFPIIEKKHIVIDGQGIKLNCHGCILPFLIDNGENVTLKNFTVDYASPFYSQALIIEADENHTVLQFDGEFKAKVGKEGEFFFEGETDNKYNSYWCNPAKSGLCLEFEADTKAPTDHLPTYFFDTGDPVDHGFLSVLFRRVTLRKLDNNRISMEGSLGFTHTVGNYWICTHSSREYPAIVINDAVNTCLENINLYHTAAMGVIGQNSENITMRRVNAVPRPNSNHILSVNADAAHFVACRGKFVMEECRFLYMMDDALNIHGIYYLPERKLSSDTLLLKFGHFQQLGINTLKFGDEFAVVNKNTLQREAVGHVVSCTLTGEDDNHINTTEKLKLILKTDTELPDFSEWKDYLIENLSANPEICISNCECGYNRPRGFLLSSNKKTVVENCTFYNMNQGIQLGGEMKDWYESGETTDVSIRNNNFEGAAYAGGYKIYFNQNIYNPNTENYYHDKVLIEGNKFGCDNATAVAYNHVNQITIK